MALQRAQSFADARPVPHPDAPQEQPVFLKGKYFIRRDGVVGMNNYVINARTDLEFVDELPEWYKDSVKTALARDNEHKEAVRKHQMEDEDRRLMQEAKIRDAIEKNKQMSLKEGSSPETAEKSAKYMIANAATVEDLCKFVEDAFDKRLDRRKNINTLRHEAEAIRVAKES